MNTLKRRFNALITILLSILFTTVSGTALAAGGNGKGVGLVNRLNGNTIDYNSFDAEDESDDSGPARGNGRGRSNNSGQGNASDGLMARIFINQDIVYTGDPLEVGFRFARGANLVSDGLADAFLVIFSPPIPVEEGEEPAETPAPIVVPLNQEIEEMVAEEESSEEEEGSEEPGTELAAPETEEETEVEEELEEEEEDEPRKLFQVAAVDTSEIPPGTYQLGLILTVPGGDPLNLDDWFNGLLGLVHIRGLTISAEALPADADGDGMMDCEPEIEGMTCDEEEEEAVEEEEEEEEPEEEPSAGDTGTTTP